MNNITSKSNSKIKDLIKLRDDSKYSSSKSLFYVEGERIINDSDEALNLTNAYPMYEFTRYNSEDENDKYSGVIDEKGDRVIKAEYLIIYPCSDGKFIALNKKYEKEAKKDSAANLKFDVLDTSGKIIFSLSTNKYKDFGTTFQNGYLDVYLEAKNEKCGGIIDEKGEIVIKPTSKIKKVGQIKDKYFTYNNGDGWGLMNMDGETIIRAKYDFLYFADNDLMVAMTKKKGGVVEYKYVNLKDEPIGADTFDDAYSFSMLDGAHAVVKVSSSLYSIIDMNGIVDCDN